MFVAVLALGACSGTQNRQEPTQHLRGADSDVAVAPNGIALDSGYKYWRVLTVSHHVNERTLHAVLGNDIAIRAARQRKTNPWPDGSKLANVVWAQMDAKNIATAMAPSDFLRVDLMVKDVEEYAQNDTGWGWARWEGPNLVAYGSNPGFDKECIACHTKVSGNDWVFTNPAELP